MSVSDVDRFRKEAEEARRQAERATSSLDKAGPFVIRAGVAHLVESRLSDILEHDIELGPQIIEGVEIVVTSGLGELPPLRIAVDLAFFGGDLLDSPSD